MNLRNLANGAPCLIRVPGVCNHDPATTVLCHVRMSGISGMGLKAPDLIAALGCSRCHDFVDGRSNPANTAEYRRTLLLEGMARTVYYWIEKGIISESGDLIDER